MLIEIILKSLTVTVRVAFVSLFRKNKLTYFGIMIFWVKVKNYIAKNENHISQITIL